MHYYLHSHLISFLYFSNREKGHCFEAGASRPMRPTAHFWWHAAHPKPRGAARDWGDSHGRGQAGPPVWDRWSQEPRGQPDAAGLRVQPLAWSIINPFHLLLLTDICVEWTRQRAREGEQTNKPTQPTMSFWKSHTRVSEYIKSHCLPNVAFLHCPLYTSEHLVCFFCLIIVKCSWSCNILFTSQQCLILMRTNVAQTLVRWFTGSILDPTAICQNVFNKNIHNYQSLFLFLLCIYYEHCYLYNKGFQCEFMGIDHQDYWLPCHCHD